MQEDSTLTGQLVNLIMLSVGVAVSKARVSGVYVQSMAVSLSLQSGPRMSYTPARV